MSPRKKKMLKGVVSEPEKGHFESSQAQSLESKAIGEYFHFETIESGSEKTPHPIKGPGADLKRCSI